MTLQFGVAVFGVGILLGAIFPALLFWEARQRVRKLEGIIKLYAAGESAVQSEARKIRASGG